MSIIEKANKVMEEVKSGGVRMPTEFNDIGFDPKFSYFTGNRKEATLSFHNISLKIGNNQILHNITGQVESGTVCALMGPSGAGKSSLMVIVFLL